MKKLIPLLLAFTFLFSFTGCGNAENKENDISQTPVYTTNHITEQPIDSNFVDTIKEIKDITNNMNGMCFPDGFDVIESFFEDESYIYTFGSPISQYVVVEYTDGSTESINEALENGHVQITDLDKYNINYASVSKLIEDIIYHSDRGGEPDALEKFYSDDTYLYSFPSIRSSVVIVYYKDGTEQTVKDALAEGKIKISDLDWFGIQYYKDPIE